VLAQILPGADPQYIAPLVHLEQSSEIAPSWQRRMVAMGGENHAKRLRLSKAEGRHLNAVSAAMQSGESTKVMAYRFGAVAALDAKIIEAATISSTLPETLHEHIAEGAKANFPVKAADLIDRMGTGPQLGAELKRLENHWLTSEFKLSKKDLLQS
jgi:poly(A) polymerase